MDVHYLLLIRQRCTCKRWMLFTYCEHCSTLDPTWHGSTVLCNPSRYGAAYCGWCSSRLLDNNLQL